MSVTILIIFNNNVFSVYMKYCYC